MVFRKIVLHAGAEPRFLERGHELYNFFVVGGWGHMPLEKEIYVYKKFPRRIYMYLKKFSKLSRGIS